MRSIFADSHIDLFWQFFERIDFVCSKDKSVLIKPSTEALCRDLKNGKRIFRFMLIASLLSSATAYAGDFPAKDKCGLKQVLKALNADRYYTASDDQIILKDSGASNAKSIYRCKIINFVLNEEGENCSRQTERYIRLRESYPDLKNSYLENVIAHLRSYQNHLASVQNVIYDVDGRIIDFLDVDINNGSHQESRPLTIQEKVRSISDAYTMTNIMLISICSLARYDEFGLKKYLSSQR